MNVDALRGSVEDILNSGEVEVDEGFEFEIDPICADEFSGEDEVPKVVYYNEAGSQVNLSVDSMNSGHFLVNYEDRRYGTISEPESFSSLDKAVEAWLSIDS
jgi:hypothetical protein